MFDGNETILTIELVSSGFLQYILTLVGYIPVRYDGP